MCQQQRCKLLRAPHLSQTTQSCAGRRARWHHVASPHFRGEAANPSLLHSRVHIMQARLRNLTHTPHTHNQRGTHETSARRTPGALSAVNNAPYNQSATDVDASAAAF